MKIACVVTFLAWLPLIDGSAFAQHHYTFEEACRRAGMTTGACAPKSQQPQSGMCTNFGRSAFHAEGYSGSGCTKVTLSPVLDAELFIEMIGHPECNEDQRAWPYDRALGRAQERRRILP